jgi:hypothetical protein
VPGSFPKGGPGRDIYFLVRNLMPKTLADRALVAALEAARGACEGELLLFGVHSRQLAGKLFGPRALEDDLAFALLAMPVDE